MTESVKTVSRLRVRNDGMFWFWWHKETHPLFLLRGMVHTLCDCVCVGDRHSDSQLFIHFLPKQRAEQRDGSSHISRFPCFLFAFLLLSSYSVCYYWPAPMLSTYSQATASQKPSEHSKIRRNRSPQIKPPHTFNMSQVMIKEDFFTVYYTFKYLYILCSIFTCKQMNTDWNRWKAVPLWITTLADWQWRVVDFLHFVPTPANYSDCVSRVNWVTLIIVITEIVLRHSIP